MTEMPQPARYCAPIGAQKFMGLEAHHWATYDRYQPTKAGDIAKFFFKDGRTLLCKITETLKAGHTVSVGGEPISISAADIAQVHRLVTIHADRP